MKDLGLQLNANSASLPSISLLRTIAPLLKLSWMDPDGE